MNASAAASQMKQLSLPWQADEGDDAPSVVYFVEAVGSGLVKIGFTTNLQERLRHMAIGNPTELRLLKTVGGGRREEAHLHRRFAIHRKGGEWFALDPLRAHIEALESLDVPIVPTCRDCGRPVKRARATRCKPCSGKHRAMVIRTQSPKPAPLFCSACNAALSSNRNRNDQRLTMLCRPCGMRKAWASPAYQASIMAARSQRRKRCRLCSQPLTSTRSTYHPECWNKVRLTKGVG